MIINRDCLEALKDLESNSIDSLVTDPPAGISFMGKEWDGDKGGREHWIAWLTDVMRECYRVLKPGAHGLVWAIPRTSHWTATALENAGFEVRDAVLHLQGQGFPKSHNIGKALEKMEMLCQCDEHEAAPNLSDLQSGISAEKQDLAFESEVLQPGMLRQASQRESSDPRPYEGDSADGQGGMDRGKSEVLSQENVWQEQSGMGGRTLHRAGQGLCDDSQAGSSEGEAERLCLRAHPGHGTETQKTPQAGRSRSSHQSQSLGQPPFEPNALCESQEALGSSPQSGLHCGQCGKVKKEIKGYGSALKPSTEIWWLVRKPLSEKNLALNVLKHGTGGINIDGCRIEAADQSALDAAVKRMTGNAPNAGAFQSSKSIQPKGAQGRFPANLVLSHNEDCVEVGTKQFKNNDGGKDTPRKISTSTDIHGKRSTVSYGTETVAAWECSPGCAVAELDRQSGILKSGARKGKNKTERDSEWGQLDSRLNGGPCEASEGGASRFFYCAKASKADRNAGLEGMPIRQAIGGGGGIGNYLNDVNSASGKYGSEKAPQQNFHPTVKSTALMSYLCRLVTPPGGTVLDPFAGSGSTGVAAIREGFKFIGIEMNAEYAAIAEARVEHERRGLTVG